MRRSSLSILPWVLLLLLWSRSSVVVVIVEGFSTVQESSLIARNNRVTSSFFSRRRCCCAGPKCATVLLPPTTALYDSNSAETQAVQQQQRKNQQHQHEKTAVVAGATGYIGRAVVQEAVRRGYRTYALVRDAAAAERVAGRQLHGAYAVQCDVTDADQVLSVFEKIAADSTGNNGSIDAVISCLASRSGVKKDAYAIDYQATLNCLSAARRTGSGAGHFVLLSAFCVKNPWLQFQHAKLKFEAALQNQSDMTYSIVRPTAFFKSVSQQLQAVQNGAPYMMFGNGEVTRCNPIAETDLACYMLNCITDPQKHNKILNVGGPDDPITMKQQGAMLFAATGRTPVYSYFPLWVFDAVIDKLQWAADKTGLEVLHDAAETARIGKYYAVEDMLTVSEDEKYGAVTLQEHYNRIAKEGQEPDPYIAVVANARILVMKLLSLGRRQQHQQQHHHHDAASSSSCQQTTVEMMAQPEKIS